MNFLSIGGIIVLFGPTEPSEMLFEVWWSNENFGRNFDHFQKIQRSLRVKTVDYASELNWNRLKWDDAIIERNDWLLIWTSVFLPFEGNKSNSTFVENQKSKVNAPFP